MPEMFPLSGVDELVATGGPADRPVDAAPQFKPGDKIRAKNLNPATPTRLPRYVRGKVGEVIQACGGYVYPDTNALLQGENPQHMYNVRFTSRELWGPDADPTAVLIISLWEGYIEPAE
jgi:hypothetical protein